MNPSTTNVANNCAHFKSDAHERRSETRNPNEVLLDTLASVHTVLRARSAEFISVTDPPADYALLAMACENIGTWPVLVGDEEKQERDTMLSSPDHSVRLPENRP